MAVRTLSRGSYMGCFNVTGASGKASEYVVEQHAGRTTNEQTTQEPATHLEAQGVLQGLKRQSSIKSHSDAEDDVQFAVSQARAGGRFRPGPLPEQKELIAPAARKE
ncbi:Putative Xanthomonas outer protein AQ [Xanthomonas hortorum pv. vitians]|nr:Putative Xanthomonas outer protein AQ [Xanthomonas hortorum pv. vitians]